MRTDHRNIVIGLITALFFAAYLHTMGPSLVPYRDAGEMATTVTQLGVVHPPGYPTYTLVGHLFTRIPLANPAYRLNLLSALAMAIAWGVLLTLMIGVWGLPAAILTVILGGISFEFWRHALISEMYTLNLLILSLLLLLLQKGYRVSALFLFGLGLGVRLDLVLCLPALIALDFSRARQELRRNWPYWAIAVAAGASVFIYVAVRARTDPQINWGDPSSLERFWAVLTRRSYGSGLDLLSQSYRLGENFGSQAILYLKHLVQDFSLLSPIFATAGLIGLWRSQRRWFFCVVLGWLCTGPLFIFLGNLPPNPHAVAIMEASYLVPNLFFLLAVGAGISLLTVRPKIIQPAAGMLALLLFVLSTRSYARVTQRQNFFAIDFIRNIVRTTPEPSLIVSRSDVPAFAMFYAHWIYPASKWRVPLPQGLAGSAWFQVMMEKQTAKLDIESMRTAADWADAARKNPGWQLYGTPDTEWTPDLFDRMMPAGLVLQYLPPGRASVYASDTLLREFTIRRGHYRYDAYRDYFIPELIEEYAKAWMAWGRFLANNGRGREAAESFRHVLRQKPDMPYAAFQLGYLHFAQGDWVRAAYYYGWAIDNFRRTLRFAERWKSFPFLRDGIRADYAQALAHAGVVEERRGHADAALSFYEQALAVDRRCADARYNLAVMYWRQERWADVVEQLQAMAEAHPKDMRWRAYLPKALDRLKR